MDKPINIFKYATKNIPFYNSYINRNIKWEEIPIVTKQNFANEPENFINKKLMGQNVIVEWTSGTTGIGLKVYKTKQEVMMSEKVIWKWRRTIIPDENIKNMLSISYRQSSFDKKSIVRDGMFGDMKCYYISIEDIAQRDAEELLAFIEEVKPYWAMVTATTFINLINKLELSNKWKKEKLNSIKVIEFMSEMVSEEQREFINARVNCLMIESYGMRETWPIGLLCEEGTFHVAEDIVFCENNEKSEIIVTSKYQKLMPIIKYNTEDIGKIIYKKCECGKCGYIIQNFQGRTPIYFDIGDGEKYSTKIFSLAVQNIQLNICNRVGKYRVIQRGNTDFIFYIEGDLKKENDIREFLERYLEQKLHQKINIKVFVKEVLLNSQIKWKVFSKEF